MFGLGGSTLYIYSINNNKNTQIMKTIIKEQIKKPEVQLSSIQSMYPYRFNVTMPNGKEFVGRVRVNIADLSNVKVQELHTQDPLPEHVINQIKVEANKIATKRKESVYTEADVLRFYRAGASDGMGANSPNDDRYMEDLNDLEARYLTIFNATR